MGDKEKHHQNFSSSKEKKFSNVEIAESMKNMMPLIIHRLLNVPRTMALCAEEKTNPFFGRSLKLFYLLITFTSSFIILLYFVTILLHLMWFFQSNGEKVQSNNFCSIFYNYVLWCKLLNWNEKRLKIKKNALKSVELASHISVVGYYRDYICIDSVHCCVHTVQCLAAQHLLLWMGSTEQ